MEITKSAILSNVKDLERFQMIIYISNSKVTKIEIFPYCSGFLFISTLSATHTSPCHHHPPPQKKRYNRTPEQEHAVPKVGKKCSFFSTVLQKGSNPFSALLTICFRSSRLRHYHGNPKMEATI